MIVGFTGTRQGMTEQQKSCLSGVLVADRQQLERYLHGGAPGADEESHYVALFDAIIPPNNIEVYPASDHRREFWRSIFISSGMNSVLHPVRPPLERDRVIAQRCDQLIACPVGMREQNRSGTWATVRYARIAKKPVVIIFPDGTVRREERNR